MMLTLSKQVEIFKPFKLINWSLEKINNMKTLPMLPQKNADFVFKNRIVIL